MKVSKRLGLYEFTESVTMGLVQGNLLYSNQDQRIPGIIPVRFNRIYNSEVEKAGPFGVGWSHEYHRALEIHEAHIIYHNDLMQEMHFKKNPDGKWHCTTQKRAVLETVDDGYSLVLIPGQMYRFNKKGRLASMEYKDGNALRFEYENECLCRIINPSGRTLYLTYNARGFIRSTYLKAGEAIRRVSYTYDVYGNLTSVTDTMGHTTSYTYRDHNLYQLTDAEARSLYFLFDSEDRVVKAWTEEEPNLKTILYSPGKRITAVVDGLGVRTEFHYNENGLIQKERWPDGTETRYRWDRSGQLIQITQPLNQHIYLAYDPSGNLISETDPDGGRTRYVYNEHQQLTRSIDPHNQTTKYFYNDRGNLVQVVEPGKRVTRFEYDNRGLLQESIDPKGGKRIFEYDDDGNITKITDEMGYVTRFEYDAWGWLEVIVDPNGGRTKKELDENNFEIKVTRPDGTAVETVRDSAGLNKEIIQPDGVKTGFTYDALGRVTGITDPLDNVITYQYDAAGNMVKVTDVNGNSTRMEYDLMRRPIRVIHSNGGIERMGYDLVGRLRERIDPGGHTTRFEYNGRGLVTRVVNAAGYSRTYQYDRRGQPVQKVDENGNKTSHRYTVEGWLSESFFADGSKMSRSYDRMGNIIYSIDQEANRTEFGYDALNRLIRVKDPLGGMQYFEYDGRDNLTATIDEAGQRWENRYDSMGRRIAEIDPTGAKWSFAYDNRGNLVKEIDPLGQMIQQVYDPLGRLSEIIRINRGSNGEEIEVKEMYRYDPAGSLEKIVDANDKTTQFHYDAPGHLTKVINPLGQEESYTYDPIGQMISRKDFNGRDTLYEYDPMGRLISLKMPTGKSEEFTYTPTGQPSAVKSADFKANYQYDVMDRVVQKKITAPFAAQLTYQYDKRGNCLAIRDDNGADIEYRYDALGRMTVLKDSTCGEWNFGYTAAGLRESVTYPNKMVAHYTYDAADRLERLVTKANDQVLERWEYEYDKSARLTAEESPGKTRKYNYDQLGRLVQVTGIDKRSGEEERISFQYDRAGNRVRKQQGSSLIQYSYDDDNRLLKAGETGFSYDANGSRISKIEAGEKTVYTYDSLKRLTNVSLPGSQDVSFGYDPAGNRVLKQVEKGDKKDRVHYLHNGPHVLREFLNGKPGNRYVHGPEIDELLCIQTPGGPKYVIPDIRKSICGLADEKGVVQHRFDYAPFGGHSPVDPGQPFAFTGREYDPETALHYYRSRYYDAAVGRFISKDPAGYHDGLNLYTYCGNDPVNYTDPSGNIAITTAVIGGAALSMGLDLLIGYCSSRANSISEYISGDEFSVGRLAINGLAGALSGGMGGWLATKTAWSAGSIFLTNVLSDTTISTIQAAAINRMEGKGFEWGESLGWNFVFNGLLHGMGYGLSKFRSGLNPIFNFAPDLGGLRGKTDPITGDILIKIGLMGKDFTETLRHEAVHRLLTPKFGRLLSNLRAPLRIIGYKHSTLLRYLEEALAETVGTKDIIKGLKHPFKEVITTAGVKLSYNINPVRLLIEAVGLGAAYTYLWGSVYKKANQE